MLKITHEHLAIYRRFRGDIDGFARGGTAHEKQIMSDPVWTCLSELLQRLAIEASEEVRVDPMHVAETTERIHKASEDKFVAYDIRFLAREETDWLRKK